MIRPTIAVLMTCHNRKALTVSSIDAVRRAGERASMNLKIYLVDDGSTDGTSDTIREAYPEVSITTGDGNLYWNQGMRRAWQEALQDVPDFYLWLNDDLAVFPDALVNMMAVYDAAGDNPTIVVGKTVDPGTGQISYGAWARQSGRSRLRFRRLNPGETSAVTMNGNFVLFPQRVVQDVGINHHAYRHSTGDTDYGLRAHRAGYSVLECPQPVGAMDHGSPTAYLYTMTLKTAYKAMTSPKGVPVREWLTFTRTHGGPMWPINFVYRYVKMLALGYREAWRGR